MLSVAVILSAAVAAGSGCAVGKGNGTVEGPIFVVGCYDDGSNFGTPAMGPPPLVPAVFNLQPTFFAGEPIDDLSNGPKANRLLMRIQRSGNGVEINDTVYVDVQNAFEVARCVRGRTMDGVPDYDTSGWCDWSGVGQDGGLADAGTPDAAAADAGLDGVLPTVGTQVRIHISNEGVVQSSMSLLFTCHEANLVGLAVDGWIDFLDFGTAAQPDLPPDMRTKVDQDFKVNFDDRLRASFHVTLADQRVITAVKEMNAIPVPFIGGTLDGFFDFDLERGRAAQPFP